MFETRLPRGADGPWRQALVCAHQAIALSDPNPRVGCVLLDAQGELAGEGHTQQAGGPHAEVMALRDALARGGNVRGGTAWVTLEPCAHFGRTPPCANALIDAGVARVEVALLDPNPLVAGQGVAMLRAAGIEVNVLPPDHPVAVAARELNIGFLSRMVRKRPWVRVKMAASVDGRTALPDGRSQWITSEAARADGHLWRARATAVLTGIGTVLADNPRLDVRAQAVPKQPWRVVLDSRWRTPIEATLLQDRPQDTWLVGLSDVDEVAATRRQRLQAAGVQLVTLPPQATDASVANEADQLGARPDLHALMRWLAELGVNELHVEAGARLTGSLIDSGLADEWLVYLAPRLLGEGRGLADVLPVKDLQSPPTWAWREATLTGDNVRLLARRIGADAF